MTKTVFAHTPAGSAFPPYVNLSRKESGIYALTVRSKGNGGLDLGTIELSPEAVEALATSALAELHREPAASTVPPHQQRVLDEKRELDERLSKLDAFILDNPLYRQLPTSEQDRMARQSEAMAAYSGVLAERIEAFGTPAATPPQAATITLPVVDPGPDSLEREIQTKADATPRWAQGQARA